MESVEDTKYCIDCIHHDRLIEEAPCNTCFDYDHSPNWESTHKVVKITPKTPDPVNHPQHYLSHPSGIECIQVTEHFGFNLGNVIKYLWRAEEKGAPLQDLKKAAWYLQREIEKREKNK